jgi:hypothetical protein
MMMETLCGLKLPTKRDKNGWNNNAKIKKRFYFLIATDDKQTKKSPQRTIIIIFVPSKVVRGERRFLPFMTRQILIRNGKAYLSWRIRISRIKRVFQFFTSST